MDQRKDAAEFLRTRRDRITPAQAGIIGGGRRRVRGLRREEVAMLAGVSPTDERLMILGSLAATRNAAAGPAADDQGASR